MFFDSKIIRIKLYLVRFCHHFTWQLAETSEASKIYTVALEALAKPGHNDWAFAFLVFGKFTRSGTG